MLNKVRKISLDMSESIGEIRKINEIVGKKIGEKVGEKKDEIENEYYQLMLTRSILNYFTEVIVKENPNVGESKFFDQLHEYLVRKSIENIDDKRNNNDERNIEGWNTVYNNNITSVDEDLSLFLKNMYHNGGSYYDRIIKMIKDHLNDESSMEVSKEGIICNSEVCRYRDFEITSKDVNLRELLLISSPYNVTRMLLRYHTILQKCDTSYISKRTIEVLYLKYKLRTETFTNPFCSKLLALNKKDCYIYSLFEDVDKPFSALCYYLDNSYELPKSNTMLLLSPPLIKSDFDADIVCKSIIRAKKMLSNVPDLSILYLGPEPTINLQKHTFCKELLYNNPYLIFNTYIDSVEYGGRYKTEDNMGNKIPLKEKLLFVYMSKYISDFGGGSRDKDNKIKIASQIFKEIVNNSNK